MDWPPYPYKAERSNPWSIMSIQRGHMFFVHCAETEDEIEADAKWLRGLGSPNRLAIYHRGKLSREVTQKHKLYHYPKAAKWLKHLRKSDLWRDRIPKQR